jgi:CTP:phosphocholine cytidylyltransferase-like protein
MKNKNFLDYIIIPMAGLGSRFQKSNFKTIKPMILVDNKSILEKSIMDLPNAQSKNYNLK